MEIERSHIDTDIVLHSDCCDFVDDIVIGKIA